MLIAASILLLVFGISVLFGAPYVPTHKSQIANIFALVDIKTTESLLDLGTGDGRVLLAGAKYGVKTHGYEINPLLWLWIKIKTWPVRSLCTVEFNNYKTASWPNDTGAIYIFGIKQDLEQVINKAKKLNKPVQIISYGFKLPGLKPTKTIGALLRYDIHQKY
jgi:hypothetical protein